MASRANRVIRMLDGKIVSDERTKDPAQLEEKKSSQDQVTSPNNYLQRSLGNLWKSAFKYCDSPPAFFAYRIGSIYWGR